MGLTLFITFILGMIIGFPISIIMGASGFLALVVNGTMSLLAVPQWFFNGINSFPLMAVPFFILAADLMSASGITVSLLRFSNNLVGHIRGGLGHVNVLTNMLFAGISGSALADAAGPGALIMRMMTRAGYDQYYAAALSASTATIGPIIPPSIIMVIYAITDNKVTIAGLFLAGVAPGVLMALALSAVNHITAIRRNFLFRSPLATWRERLLSMWRAVPALLMPAIIVGGILSGLFTATEASAVAVFYALFVGFFITKKLTLRNLPKVVVQSALVTSAALLIVSMASLFANILTLVQIPQMVAAYISGVSRDPTLVMTIVVVFVLICGLFIDTLPASTPSTSPWSSSWPSPSEWSRRRWERSCSSSRPWAS
jgi:tripartite ATP-independent transporter DctM subunit